MCPDAAGWTQVQGVGGAPTLGGCFQGVWAWLHPAAAHRRETCVVRGLCGGSGYQGSGRRYPEHPLVRSGQAPATWVRQGKPPHPRDTARGSPGPTATACAMAGCGEEMEALASGVHPPQPGRTRGCPGLYLWSAGIGGQSSRGSSSTSPGRSAVTSRPRVRLQPVSSYSRSRAPCHHTTPRRPRRCRASQELHALGLRSQPRHLLAVAAPLSTSASLSSVLRHCTSTFKHL